MVWLVSLSARDWIGWLLCTATFGEVYLAMSNNVLGIEEQTDLACCCA